MSHLPPPLRQSATHPIWLIIAVMVFSCATFWPSLVLAQQSKVGRYTTNYGPLILYQGKDERIAGFYYYQGLPAHLFLKRNGTGSYKGIWVQASSEKKCVTKKNGSPYWGTINAAFNGDKFLALWGYCNADLVNKKSFQWKGKLK